MSADFDGNYQILAKLGDVLVILFVGYIDTHVNEVPSGWQFNIGRDYLLPIPQKQITLNPD